MKAVIYCRKSTDQEDKQIQSLEAQLIWTREYCNNNNLEIIEIIQESKSAKQTWRIGFNKMLDFFDEKKADVIVTWQLNRLSRNPRDNGTIQWYVQEWIIKAIHSTDWTMDWNNALLMAIHFWMANQYVLDLKKNVTRWLKQKFEAWGAINMAPTWYVNNKLTKQYEIDPEKKEMIEELFKMRAEKHTYKYISEYLFKLWYKNKSWKRYTNWRLQSLVSNVFYIWFIKRNWEIWNWIHKTFISKKLFDKANNLGYKWHDEIQQGQFIFKNLIRYEWKAMKAYKTKWNIYYRSWNSCDTSFNISQKKLIELVWEYLIKYSMPKEIEKEFINSLFVYFKKMNKWNKANIDKIRSKIDKLRNERKELVKKNIKWVIDDDLFKEMNLDNLLTIKNLEDILIDYWTVDQLIEREVGELFKTLTQTQELWNNWNLEQKSIILKIIEGELYFDTKKQLHIRENELFSILKSLNSSVWWCERSKRANYYTPLFHYIYHNQLKIKDLNSKLKQLK